MRGGTWVGRMQMWGWRTCAVSEQVVQVCEGRRVEAEAGRPEERVVGGLGH